MLPIEIEGECSKVFQKLIAQIKELYNIGCNFKSDSLIDKMEDPAAASTLYYIAQEATRNAIHHGQADEIEITFSADDDFLLLTIKDNGIGYEEVKYNKGKGINIMRHRAELLGGTLEITKSPDVGTIVKCKVPLEKILKRNRPQT